MSAITNPPVFAMDRISVPLSGIGQTVFDVIVIGSGYGGSIAASRLARAGQKVCLLERGREILPGQYPRTLAAARAETQIATAAAGWLDPASNGMMELRINDDMHVVLGCGLGGGSLVNAGVAFEPDPRVFRQHWPKVYQDPGELGQYYDGIRKMLGSAKLPQTIKLNKLAALQQSAGALGLEAELLDINVSFADGPNEAGIFQAACTLCGDCCSGCNYGAKNTLLMNYLPDAHKHGAVIVTEAEVHNIGPLAAANWQVTVDDRTLPIDPAKRKVLTAPVVVLAAGSLGSTEILARSQASGGLTLSKAQLGKRFSGNGDVLGFGFAANLKLNADAKLPEMPNVYSIGAGANAPDQPQFRPGPCITGVIKVGMGEHDDLSRALVIEDGVAPGALSMVYPAMLFLQDALDADFSNFPDTQTRLQALADLGNAVQSGGDPSDMCYTGAIARTQSYLVMSHDGSAGELQFNPATGLVRVDWPGAGRKPPYSRDNDMLRRAAEGIWANYIANPLWSEDFGNMLVTVHPVGGCTMADSAADGVVDADCRVYTGTGDAVYDGLLVCDGSVIPTSLGVNPLLTISAIADRAMDKLIARQGWVSDKTPNPMSWVPLQVAATPAPGGGVDAEAITKLEELAPLLFAVSVACDHGKTFVDFAVTALIMAAFPVQDQPSAIAEALKDIEDADLKGDIKPAAIALAEDIADLLLALKFPPPGKSGFQSMFDKFLALVKDVSPGLSFAETMSGYGQVSPAPVLNPVSDPYRVAEAAGRASGRSITGQFKVDAPSTLKLTGADPGVARVEGARLRGTVTLTASDGKAAVYPIVGGHFDLLQPEGSAVETWTMTYAGRLGSAYEFTGTKYLRRRPGSGWWRDMTTLYVDFSPLGGPAGQPALKGVMQLGVQDLARQAGTITGAFTAEESLADLEQTIADDIKAGTFHIAVTSGDLLHRIAKVALALANTSVGSPTLAGAAALLQQYFEASVAGLFGQLIFRTYGGLPAYLNDFPAADVAAASGFKVIPDANGGTVPGHPAQKSQLHVVPTQDGSTVQLYHFPALASGNGPVKGPVILAPGFATTALSYAMLTNKKSLVEMLLDENYDVWLFDNRSSPLIAQPDKGYAIDDIVAYDWPAAVDFVLAQTGQKDLQVLAHCMGSMTAQMALLSGSITKVRQLISSQLTVHPVANWFNMLKADTQMANAVINGVPDWLKSILKTYVTDAEILALLDGLKSVSSISQPVAAGQPGYEGNMAINMLAWNAPFAGSEPCLSPTCHRIFGIYGPVFAHDNLNAATHTWIRQVFGTISTRPFEQLALMMRAGRALDQNGNDTYLPNVARLRLPIHMISGALNQEFLPDGTFRTLDWLQRSLPDSKDLFTRKVYDGYAHMDCFIGQNAHLDIFPDLLKTLNRYCQPASPGSATA